MKLPQALLAALALATALFASSAIADGIDKSRLDTPDFSYPYNSPFF